MQRTKRVKIEIIEPGKLWKFVYEADRKGVKRHVVIVFDYAKQRAKTIEPGGLPHKVTWHLEKEVAKYAREFLV